MTRTFSQWELAMRMAMVERGVDHQAIQPVIDAVKAHCEQSGQDPWEAFGTPEDFAADVATERPPGERADVDARGNTAGDYVSAALLSLAMLAIPATVVIAVTSGTWTVAVTVAGAVGAGVFVLCWMIYLAAADALRAAGYPRLAPWSYVVGIPFVLAASLAFTALPKTHLFALPVVVILAVAVAAIWALTRVSQQPSRQDLASTSDPADRDTTDPVALVKREPSTVDRGDNEHWFNRLNGLLIGRFDVSPTQASDLVREARSHVYSSGGNPEDEFGPVATYARILADSELQREIPLWRTPRALAIQKIAFFAGLVWISIYYWAAGDEWVSALAITLAALTGWSFSKHARSRRSSAS